MPILVDQFGAPLSTIDDTDVMYLDKGDEDGYVNALQVKTYINPALNSLDAVSIPSLLDLFITEQSGVNKKITGTQIRQAILNDEDFEELLASYCRRGFLWLDHFFPALTGWAVAVGGTGSSIFSLQGGAAPFFYQGSARTRIGANMSYSSALAGNCFYIGLGKTVWECRLNLASLNDSPLFKFGLMDTQASASGPDQANGVYFEYDPITNANWRRCCAQSSIRTKNNCALAPAANSTTILKIIINPDASSAEFFVDGISVGTETTNLPLNTTELKPGVYAFKQGAVGTLISQYYDYVKTYVIYNSQINT